jgi:hypothetical protein
MTGRQRMLLDNPQKTHSSTISLFARGTSVQRHPTLAFRAHLQISAAQLDFENASVLSQDIDTGIFTDVAGILILPSGLHSCLSVAFIRASQA